MSTLTANPPSVFTEADIASAKEAKRLLTERRQSATPLDLRDIAIPAPAADLLLQILDEMSQGHGVKLTTPVEHELTRQEAANLLDIPEPAMTQLLDEGKVQFRTDEAQRIVSRASAVAYAEVIEAERLVILAEMVAIDQELGLY